jgi:hypothetical protein
VDISPVSVAVGAATRQDPQDEDDALVIVEGESDAPVADAQTPFERVQLANVSGERISDEPIKSVDDQTSNWRVQLGNPTKGAAVMLAAPFAALDLPLKVLVWEDGNGVVSVSYNSPGFMAERLHIKGALRAPFDAVESIVEPVLGA